MTVMHGHIQNHRQYKIAANSRLVCVAIIEDENLAQHNQLYDHISILKVNSHQTKIISCWRDNCRY